MMRILYPLLCYYPSQGGGPANTIFWLNKALGKLGFTSIVISTKYGLRSEDVDYRMYKANGIEVEFVNNSLISFLTLMQIKKIKESDVIHFSSIFFSPTLFYILLGIFFSKKIVLSPRGELYGAALDRSSLKKQVYLKILSLFQTKIDFHATNTVELEMIRDLFSRCKSSVVIPNFIELPEKVETEKKDQFLFLGRINPIKNIDLLIEAFSRLDVNLSSRYKLVIAGDASLPYELAYFETLKTLVKLKGLSANVFFVGAVYGREKSVLISESYCLILPSKSENFGNVVVEALSQGVPVIVSKNAPWKVAEEAEAGFWVEPSIEALEFSLNRIVSISSEEYEAMSFNAYNLAADKFNIKKNIEIWNEFYNKK